MKQLQIIIVGLLIALAVWGSWSSWQNQEPAPKSPREMTEQERIDELQKTLEKVGVTLPDDWADMTRKERGEFLLKSEILPPEFEGVFEE